MKKKEIFQRRGKYHFSALEIEEMKNDSIVATNGKTAALARIDEHKSAIKDLKATAASLDAANKERARKVEDGFEFRPLDCYREKDYDEGVFIFYDCETAEEVCREPFTREDFQRSIEDDE